MPGFSDSFWTPDYATGLGVLYGKLQQGVVENRQILTIASMRADAEEQYGLRMGDIAPSVDRMSAAGFGKDDGASVRKVSLQLNGELEGELPLMSHLANFSRHTKVSALK
jgi:hypothetical protein